MKSLVTALILLILMLSCVVWNYIYINDVFASMNASLDAIPDLSDEGCEAACERLGEQWKKHTDRVGLSVCFGVLDRVSEQVELLRSSAACGDRYGFESARTLLRDALEDMRRLERISIGNLF